MTPVNSERVQAAVDTGGTFTDVAVRREDGSLFVWKVPSTPERPDDAVIDGITGAINEMGIGVEGVEHFVHGTTVATNTVLTRTGASVGLITTAGFRDLLAIGHQARPALYDQRRRSSEPLVADDHILEIDERITADGDELRPVDDTEVQQLADRARELGLEVLVVSFLNAYVNPEHEQLVAARLRELNAAPAVFATTEVATEMREYERTSTATINAYVQPKISTYVQRLSQRLQDEGIPAPLWIMQSNGGLLTPQRASENSARIVLSGLAGGVVGAARWATQLGLKQAVSFDIGGTSTDIALIRGGQPDETMTGEVDELPLRLPAVDVHTIGAGGGSIAWLDTGGGLRVGPQSAGAVPGPIAYQRGGTELTVTDAHAVVGRLGKDLLGGRFTLDIDAARQRMREWGAQLGLSAEATAEGILKVISATMARGVRKVSVERGVDVRSCDLIAFGGAGPLHAGDLLHELGMKSAVIPQQPGIASAVGMIDAPERHDFAASVAITDAAGYGTLQRIFDDLVDEAREAMQGRAASYEYYVDARYAGQSYELTISHTHSWGEQRRLLDAAHEERYGFQDPDAHMEIVVARLVALHGGTDPDPVRDTRELAEAHPIETRPVYCDGAWRDTPVYERADLTPGTVLVGPAVLNQFDTTTFVRPNQQCRVDEYGFLHLSEMSNDD